MRFFVSAGIQARLFRVLLLSLGGIAVVLVLLWQWRIDPALRSGVEQRQKQLLQRAANDIIEFVNGRANRLVTVGEVGRFWEASRDARKQALIRLMKLDPQIREIFFADAAGREVIRLSRDRINIGSDDVSVAQEPKFREPMKGNVFISEVGYDRAAEPFVTLSVPVRFTAAEISGAMIADISLKTLWNAVAEISAESLGIVSVVDENGRLIAHPDYSKVLLAANAARSAEPKGRSSGVKSDSIAALERKSGGGPITIQNRLEIPKLRWTVIVEEPEEAALGQLRAVQWAFFAILGFTIAGAFGFSAYFSGRITGPIRELERRAQLLAEGNLEQRLDIRTGDEIESLAGQFNRMAASLEDSYEGLERKIAERTQDLSALYGALAPLASSDAKQLLQKVVERLKEATHTDAALIRVFDKEKNAFVCPARIGFPAIFLDAARELQESSAVGEVFLTGKPIIAADIAEDSRVKVKRQLEAGFRSCAFLPLRVSGELRGVIHLASGKLGHFTEDKADHLMTIARQMGVAIENIELYEEATRASQEQQVLREFLSNLLLLDVDELLRRMTEQAALLFKAEYARVRLFDEQGRIKTRAVAGDKAVLESMSLVGERRESIGRSRRMLDSHKPFAIKDMAQEVGEGARPSRGVRAGLHGYLGAPLLGRDRKNLGIVHIMTRTSRDFTQRDLNLIEQFANGAAIALENARLFDAAQKNLRRIHALREIDQAISSTLDLRNVLDVLMEKIDLVLPYNAVTIRLFDKGSGLLEPVACRNLDETEWKTGPWRGGRGIANVVFETRAPLIVRNAQDDPRVLDAEFYTKHNLTSYVGVPLIVKDEALGVLGFYTKEEHDFTGEEVEFLSTLAGQAAIAIHNSQLYEDAAKLATELSRSNKVKDEFLSVMSHELRTPLSVVMGYAGLIKDGMLGHTNPEQNNALDKLMSRSNDLLGMITGILHATSIEANEVRVESSEFASVDLLDDLRRFYQTHLAKPLMLDWSYPSKLPVMTTDREKLKSVLQNIINNAIKFTEKGRITISAVVGMERDGGGKPAEFIEFKVADTGIGIPKEKLPVIFEKFRQADSSETRLFEGVGLGLYIAKNFTEILGGKIEVETGEGKGSIFTVTVPCALSAPVVERREVPKRVRSA